MLSITRHYVGNRKSPVYAVKFNKIIPSIIYKLLITVYIIVASILAIPLFFILLAIAYVKGTKTATKVGRKLGITINVLYAIKPRINKFGLEYNGICVTSNLIFLFNDSLDILHHELAHAKHLHVYKRSIANEKYKDNMDYLIAAQEVTAEFNSLMYYRVNNVDDVYSLVESAQLRCGYYTIGVGNMSGEEFTAAVLDKVMDRYYRGEDYKRMLKRLPEL